MSKPPLHQVISSAEAPPALGPYSQGIRTSQFVFLAGQIPLVGSTGSFIPGGITEQTEQVITNIRALLAAERLTLADIVKTTVFLADMSDFTEMNAVYSKHFSVRPPARSTVQVARLPKDALVEIEVIALAPAVSLAEEVEHAALAKRVYQAAHLTGTFVLRSGATSNEYFDKYLFEANPVLLHDIAQAMVPKLFPGADALAGLEMGGLPLATMLSQLTGLPTRFVRKQAKSYGTCKIAEGGALEGKKLVIVEDVITSGGAVLDAAKALKAEGATLLGVVCVIDRESGGRKNLAELGLNLNSLFTMTELKANA